MPTIQESLGAIERSVREGNDEFRQQFKDAETLVASQAEVLKGLGSRTAAIEEALKARKLHSLPGSEAKRFSWGHAYRGVALGIWDDAEFEREVLTTRAQSQGDDTKGGYLVPIQHMADPIEGLKAQAVALRAGATPILGLTGGNLEIPRVTTATTIGAQSSEGVALAATDVTLGQVVIAEKTIGAIVLVSKKVLRNSPGALDTFILHQLIEDGALQADYYAFRGSGSSGQPTGIINVSGINTKVIGANGGNLTNEVLIDMEGTIEDDNAWPVDDNRMKVVWHPGVKRVLKKQRIAQYSAQASAFGYMYPGVSNRALAEFLGYDHFATTNLRNTTAKGTSTTLGDVILGNFTQLLWCVWGNPELAVSEHYRFAEDQIALKLVLRLGFGVRHPDAFCLCADAETTYV